jgi:hypothetical protein
MPAQFLERQQPLGGPAHQSIAASSPHFVLQSKRVEVFERAGEQILPAFALPAT